MNAAQAFYPRSIVTFRFPVPFRQRAKLCVIGREEIEWMLRQLRGRGWRTATELGARSGGQKRKLKAIVEAAQGAILHFPGSPGFKLMEEATRAQIQRGIAALRLEARRPLQRALFYRRELHRRRKPVTGDLFHKVIL